MVVPDECRAMPHMVSRSSGGGDGLPSAQRSETCACKPCHLQYCLQASTAVLSVGLSAAVAFTALQPLPAHAVTPEQLVFLEARAL